MCIPVGIAGIGTHFPNQIETAADLAGPTGIPEEILREKMGIRQRHVAGEADSVTAMATAAAQRAITEAGITPADIRMVISHGSEHKDHLVWNAAAKIQHNIGAENAFAFEMYALCASAPIAMNIARGMMQTDQNLDHVLLAAGSRENDLVNLQNTRSRFMFNFGSGGGAMVLKRNAEKNLILGASAITDGSLSETVILTEKAIAEGTPETIGDLRGRLDVTNSEYMAERLGANSLENFVKVITQSVEQGGATVDDIAFLGITHMKRSFYKEILGAVGITTDQSVYLEDHGHVQSVDQALAIQLGLAQGKIKPGDIIVLAGAGTGYTWSAIAVRWG
jgi:3-oxoacyl-[acyl-carrier-protein] synthase III